MFKLKENRKSVKKVCSNGIVLFFLTTENNIFQDGKLLFEGEANSDIRICKNHFYTFGNSDISYLGDFIDNSVTKIDFTFSSECIWRDGAIINENYRYDTFDGKVKAGYSILNFKTKEKRLLFKDLEGIITCLFDDNKKAIFRLKTTLKSLSLLAGEYEWEIDLGERLGEYDVIAKIIGVVDDVLWVISQRGILFGIAVHSGEVLHHINYDNIASHEEKGRVNAVYFYFLFDEINKKLIGIRDKVYWEIDLTDPENGLQKFDLVAANPAYFNDPSFVYRGIPWANPIGKIFEEDYIYFADIEIATVGVMNRQTKEIEWHTRLNDQEPRVRDVINDIRVSANKLYALDTGGTLHIFEKDNNQTV